MNTTGRAFLATLLATLALALGGCGSNPRVASEEPRPPVASDKDGTPEFRPELLTVQDAVPRPERITMAGNKSPYTVLGETYVVRPVPPGWKQRGFGSWYGTKFHGQKTSNGEPYDVYAMTAAHKTLPIPSYVRVTNLQNGRQAIVRVNDRGPFHDGRVIDLSYAAAYRLGMAGHGTAPVEVELLDPNAPEWVARRNGTAPVDTIAAARPVPAGDAPPRYPLAVAAAPRPAHTEQAPLPAATGGGTWLQAGAFRSLDGARQFAARLEALLGRDATIQTAGEWHRVRVGPLRGSEATEVQRRIAAASLGMARIVTD